MSPLVLAAIIAGGASLVGAGINAYSTYKTNKTMMERDDNAISRRALDLQNAGLSPVLAAGSGASTSNLTAPQVDTDTFSKSAALTMAMKQGYAQLGQTEAQTALTQFQAQNEDIRSAYYNGQIDLQKAQLEHQNLENAWFTQDMSTRLGLRDAQTRQVEKDILRTEQQTQLLSAQTAYEQERKKQLLHQIDIAKIDKAIRDLDFRNYYGDKYYSRFGHDTASNISKTFSNGLSINGIWSYPSDYDFNFYTGE